MLKLCKCILTRIEHTCQQHESPWDCDTLLIQTSCGDIGIPIRDGGSSYVVIKFCPWCGQSCENKSENRIDWGQELRDFIKRKNDKELELFRQRKDGLNELRQEQQINQTLRDELRRLIILAEDWELKKTSKWLYHLGDFGGFSWGRLEFTNSIPLIQDLVICRKLAEANELREANDYIADLIDLARATDSCNF